MTDISARADRATRATDPMTATTLIDPLPSPVLMHRDRLPCRDGNTLLEVLVAVAILGAAFVIFSQALEGLQGMAVRARTPQNQTIIPRQVIEYWRRTPYSNLPASTQYLQFDSVGVNATRVTNLVASRIPRFQIVVADIRQTAIAAPDTFTFDMNPYVAWPSVTSGFNIGDHRP